MCVHDYANKGAQCDRVSARGVPACGLRHGWRQERRWHGWRWRNNCSRCAGRTGSNGWKRAGEFVLGSGERSDQLSRKTSDGERRPVHPSRGTDDGFLHGQWRDEWHDLLLRCIGGRFGGRKRQLGASQCRTCCASASSCCASRIGRDCGECASLVDVDGKRRSDELSRKTRDGERRTLHTGWRSNRWFLYRYWADEWHDLLLRCIGGGLGRRKCELGASQCRTCCASASSCSAGRISRDCGECTSFVDVDGKQRSDELSRKTRDGERRTLYAGWSPNFCRPIRILGSLTARPIITLYRRWTRQEKVRTRRKPVPNLLRQRKCLQCR